MLVFIPSHFVYMNSLLLLLLLLIVDIVLVLNLFFHFFYSYKKRLCAEYKRYRTNVEASRYKIKRKPHNKQKPNKGEKKQKNKSIEQDSKVVKTTKVQNPKLHTAYTIHHTVKAKFEIDDGTTVTHGFSWVLNVVQVKRDYIYGLCPLVALVYIDFILLIVWSFELSIFLLCDFQFVAYHFIDFLYELLTTRIVLQAIDGGFGFRVWTSSQLLNYIFNIPP